MGGVDVVNVERQMVPTDVAVPRQRAPLIGRLIFEELHVVVSTQPDHGDGALRTWIDVEPQTHSVAPLIDERSVDEDQLGAEMVDEERNGLVEVGTVYATWSTARIVGTRG